MSWREWTEAQRLAWGLDELEARKRDLANITSQDALNAAKDAAEARRKRCGISRDDAVGLVQDALRYKRRQNQESL